MNWKDCLLIVCLALLTSIAFAIFQSSPGYMDAEYYYAMGLRIARDHTLTEPFSWNYLHGFSGLPQPGFTFWMPFPAFLASVSMFITRGYGFFIARTGFIFLSVILPVITAWIAFEISGRRKIGLAAGLFSVFPGFYSPFLVTTDSFGLIMLFGGVYLLVAKKIVSEWKFFFLGLLAGLMHLTRTDGFIWIVPAVLIALSGKGLRKTNLLRIFLGYLIVMAPWFLRNWYAMGSILPAGTSRVFWMTSYNDLFLYHTELLSWDAWIGQGAGPIMNSFIEALVLNLQTSIFIQGQILLFPLILIGYVSIRSDKIIRSILIAWFLVFALMTIVFPFAGSRGGFFHSGAAFQPLFWLLAAMGLAEFTEWGVKKRRWDFGQAFVILLMGLVAMLLGVTAFVHRNRVQGHIINEIEWNQSYYAAVEVDKGLSNLNVPDDQLIMINNPPGLYIASGRSSITIPSGGAQEVIEVARDSGVKILVLEKNHPQNLNFLYEDPDGFPGLFFMGSDDGVQYFRILQIE